MGTASRTLSTCSRCPTYLESRWRLCPANVFTPAQSPFCFFLPLSPLIPHSLAPVPSQPVCETWEQRGQHDESEATMLARMGYECTIAANSQDAIRCLHAHLQPCAHRLADASSGRNLSHAAHRGAVAPHLPIFVLTANVLETD
ncbi:unnamed protein product [Closterium sp. Yama58-4]|nr:unnamed protein product [Closterium sp. Yama58-4]